MGERDELEELLAQAQVEPQLAARLAAYGAHLLEENRRVNLTGARTPEALLPHLLDSLTVLPYVDGPLIDVGSGGGLPAIPLAIASGQPVTLVESITKKAVFLEGALAALGLTGTVVPLRAEVAAHDAALRERFAVGTARAVGLAPAVLEILLPFLQPGGRAVLQRGLESERERRATADAALMLGAQIEDEAVLSGTRRLLVVRKTASTPGRFPRRPGVPEKRPLCW